MVVQFSGILSTNDWIFTLYPTKIAYIPPKIFQSHFHLLKKNNNKCEKILSLTKINPKLKWNATETETKNWENFLKKNKNDPRLIFFFNELIWPHITLDIHHNIKEVILFIIYDTHMEWLFHKSIIYIHKAHLNPLCRKHAKTKYFCCLSRKV